ncbi:hypothetical protein QUA20_18225 [Microcoleus sp. Pol7_A1]|uniref:hypothetical protein n=1 Tax=Microcoleus sp. Pol7_A1 TaxID=2818893 RepID=UPI002FCF621E
MPKWLGKVLGIGAGTILLLGASGYWYVFIAGAPQLDPPKVVADADLNFQLKTYIAILNHYHDCDTIICNT